MKSKLRLVRKTIKALCGWAVCVFTLTSAFSLKAQVDSGAWPDAPAPVLLAYDAAQNQPLSPASSTSAAAPQGNLGLDSDQAQSGELDQRLLDKRAHMIKMHQRLGLLTTIPLAASLFSGSGATCERSCTGMSGAEAHAAIGSVALGMYAATAYYAIAAPTIPGTGNHGALRWHEGLAWVHGTGMILTPVLGAMAYNQRNSGQKVHGIASAHSAVAVTTAGAYAAALVTIYWPIKLKFWEAR